MSQSFQNNHERVDYLVGVVAQLAASMATAHAAYSSPDVSAADRAAALRQIVGDAGGLRTVGYNLARIGADELQALLARNP